METFFLTETDIFGSFFVYKKYIKVYMTIVIRTAH
jgi:hypothetical protein